MSQSETQDETPLDQTFSVNIENPYGGPSETQLRLLVDADPDMTGDIPVEVHASGQHIKGTLTTQDPQTGFTDSEGQHVIEFNSMVRQFRTRFGDFIMNGATAVVIPDEVGDRIREHFDQPTLPERRSEAAERSLKAQLRVRMENDDDFRNDVADLLTATE